MISAGSIVAWLEDECGLTVAQVTLLSLEVDGNAPVHRIDAADGVAYFLKLRCDAFDEFSVSLARFLIERGIEQIIAPLATNTGRP